MEFELLKNLGILLAFAILALLICYRFKLPEIIGLFITGLLMGPHGIGVFTNMHEIEYIAEIGVVLLLFTIGLEFSFKSLINLKKQFFIGGTVQMTLIFVATFLIASMLGLSQNAAILAGFMLSLSSTAIVLKLLQDRDELDTPQGNVIMGIIIFEDIIAVFMMLAIPLMSGKAGNIIESVPTLVLAAIVIGIILIAGTLWVVPRVLHRIARTRSNELFVLCIVVICLAMASLTSQFGLSLALGAFLAGLIISESPYSRQALGTILPFRYVFTSFFFISIGMMLDLHFFISNPWIIIAAAIIGILIKLFSGTITTLLLGYTIRVAVIEGISMAQVGEFSFILASLGLAADMINADLYQIFLATAILTMAASPFLISYSQKLSDTLCRLPLPARLKASSCPIATPHENITDHLVIIGYGLNGRNLARAAKAAKIPYTIVEMNPDTVSAEQAKGEPIHYGDATNEIVLEHLNLENAKIAVIAISNVEATRRITSTLRKHFPHLHIIVRTRYTSETQVLKELGASEVVPEEFETSVEIFASVLRRYFIPKSRIDQLTAELRSENYEVFRSPAQAGYSLDDLVSRESGVDIATVRIGEDLPLMGKSIKDLGLRNKYGVTILMVYRNDKQIYNPDPGTVLEPGDLVYAFGRHDRLTEAFNDLRSRDVA
ncbi:cation:proton antiporter domain-containing protein [Methanocella arvoryzae]|uniref:Predicted glutathione-regulated K(+) efflux system protein n=1 Tax=Methanocella arvoryzae (strain DSM 22066 / NBRC 105507 / MRE50) TaxID=351160 RepID=Q0W1A1_METAR|nr:cation:proton antiporter [Methanocella arvoryzae]CAJ37842.1 predicted glutathione-regulated K(+) efflux system protein [Methanocella arvoryzae MRE50]